MKGSLSYLNNGDGTGGPYFRGPHFIVTAALHIYLANNNMTIHQQTHGCHGPVIHVYVHNMYMYYVLLGALQSAPKSLLLNTEQCEMYLECREAIPDLSPCVSYDHLVMAVITVHSCRCINSHYCMYCYLQTQYCCILGLSAVGCQ